MEAVNVTESICLLLIEKDPVIAPMFLSEPSGIAVPIGTGLIEELERSSILGIPYVIVHLGSHGGKGTDNGIDQLAKACNIAFKNYNRSSLSKSALATEVAKDNKKKSEGRSPRQNKPVTIILENSAGEKNSIGSKFNELGLILDNLRSSGSHKYNKTSSFGFVLIHVMLLQQVMI